MINVCVVSGEWAAPLDCRVTSGELIILKMP